MQSNKQRHTRALNGPLDFAHPVGDGGLGGDDNVGPADPAGLLQKRQQRDGHEGLAQTHLIRENPDIDDEPRTIKVKKDKKKKMRTIPN